MPTKQPTQQLNFKGKITLSGYNINPIAFFIIVNSRRFFFADMMPMSLLITPNTYSYIW